MKPEQNSPDFAQVNKLISDKSPAELLADSPDAPPPSVKKSSKDLDDALFGFANEVFLNNVDRLNQMPFLDVISQEFGEEINNLVAARNTIKEKNWKPIKDYNFLISVFAIAGNASVLISTLYKEARYDLLIHFLSYLIEKLIKTSYQSNSDMYGDLILWIIQHDEKFILINKVEYAALKFALEGLKSKGKLKTLISSSKKQFDAICKALAPAWNAQEGIKLNELDASTQNKRLEQIDEKQEISSTENLQNNSKKTAIPAATSFMHFLVISDLKLGVKIELARATKLGLYDATNSFIKDNFESQVDYNTHRKGMEDRASDAILYVSKAAEFAKNSEKLKETIPTLCKYFNLLGKEFTLMLLLRFQMKKKNYTLLSLETTDKLTRFLLKIIPLLEESPQNAPYKFLKTIAKDPEYWLNQIKNLADNYKDEENTQTVISYFYSLLTMEKLPSIIKSLSELKRYDFIKSTIQSIDPETFKKLMDNRESTGSNITQSYSIKTALLLLQALKIKSTSEEFIDFLLQKQAVFEHFPDERPPKRIELSESILEHFIRAATNSYDKKPENKAQFESSVFHSYMNPKFIFSCNVDGEKKYIYSYALELITFVIKDPNKKIYACLDKSCFNSLIKYINGLHGSVPTQIRDSLFEELFANITPEMLCNYIKEDLVEPELLSNLLKNIRIGSLLCEDKFLPALQNLFCIENILGEKKCNNKKIVITLFNCINLPAFYQLFQHLNPRISFSGFLSNYNPFQGRSDNSPSYSRLKHLANAGEDGYLPTLLRFLNILPLEIICLDLKKEEFKDSRTKDENKIKHDIAYTVLSFFILVKKNKPRFYNEFNKLEENSQKEVAALLSGIIKERIKLDDLEKTEREFYNHFLEYSAVLNPIRQQEKTIRVLEKINRFINAVYTKQEREPTDNLKDLLNEASACVAPGNILLNRFLTPNDTGISLFKKGVLTDEEYSELISFFSENYPYTLSKLTNIEDTVLSPQLAQTMALTPKEFVIIETSRSQIAMMFTKFFKVASQLHKGELQERDTNFIKALINEAINLSKLCNGIVIKAKSANGGVTMNHLTDKTPINLLLSSGKNCPHISILHSDILSFEERTVLLSFLNDDYPLMLENVRKLKDKNGKDVFDHLKARCYLENDTKEKFEPAINDEIIRTIFPERFKEKTINELSLKPSEDQEVTVSKFYNKIAEFNSKIALLCNEKDGIKEEILSSIENILSTIKKETLVLFLNQKNIDGNIFHYKRAHIRLKTLFLLMAIRRAKDELVNTILPFENQQGRTAYYALLKNQANQYISLKLMNDFESKQKEKIVGLEKNIMAKYDDEKELESVTFIRENRDAEQELEGVEFIRENFVEAETDNAKKSTRGKYYKISVGVLLCTLYFTKLPKKVDTINLTLLTNMLKHFYSKNRIASPKAYKKLHAIFAHILNETNFMAFLLHSPELLETFLVNPDARKIFNNTFKSHDGSYDVDLVNICCKVRNNGNVLQRKASSIIPSFLSSPSFSLLDTFFITSNIDESRQILKLIRPEVFSRAFTCRFKPPGNPTSRTEIYHGLEASGSVETDLYYSRLRYLAQRCPDDTLANLLIRLDIKTISDDLVNNKPSVPGAIDYKESSHIANDELLALCSQITACWKNNTDQNRKAIYNMLQEDNTTTTKMKEIIKERIANLEPSNKKESEFWQALLYNKKPNKKEPIKASVKKEYEENEFGIELPESSTLNGDLPNGNLSDKTDEVPQKTSPERPKRMDAPDESFSNERDYQAEMLVNFKL